jgi:FMN phosphatase YigB (HAD superfamily)
MLKMLELSPHEVLFVGDTPQEDVVGAKAAQIPVAWLRGAKGALPENIPEPDFVITKLTELPSLLDQ